MEINLLFSIDDHYMVSFKTTLYSVYQNTPSALLHVFVLQKQLLKKHAEIESFCEALGIVYNPVVIGERAFEDAQIADILCLNDIFPLYKMELGAALYAAASRGSDTNMTDLGNKLRL